MSVSLCAAAAGAGKTHKLVQVYLSYALQDPTKFSEIVAITFTNKATQEMKERVLHYLELLAHGKATTLQEALCDQLSYDKETLQEKATTLQRLILAHYGDFSIYTIDQFFQTLVRSLAPTLHLAPDYALVLEEAPLLRQALATLLATLPNYTSLERSLIDFSLYRMKQGKHWNCTEDILNLGHVMLQQGELSSQKVTFELLEKLFEELSEHISQFEDTLANLATELLALIEQQNWKVADFAWKERGIVGFLTKVKEKKRTPLSTRIRKGATETRYWISQQSPKEPTIAPFVRSTLQPLLQKLITFYDTHHRAYATATALKSLYYALATTTRLAHLVDDYCQKEDSLRMSTSYGLLAKVLLHTPIDVLYKKLGRSYRYFLIDEFQDVSIAQWKALQPLLDHSLGVGGSSFLVGDVKQSIYRWRGGTPSLFLSQVATDMGAERIVREWLGYNWRSQAAIITFNNLFFVAAAKSITHYLQEKIRKEVAEGDKQVALLQEATTIQQAYAQTVQQIPPQQATDEKGYVHICAFPEKKENDQDYTWQQAAIDYMLEQITHLQQTGINLGDIGILVRNHREANLLMQAFTAQESSPSRDPRYHYNATMVGGIPLASNPYVELVIYAMRYVQAPLAGVDLAAFLHLCATYGQGSMDKNSTNHALFSALNDEKAVSARLPIAFVQQLPQLARLPLYSLAMAVIDLFKLDSPAVTPYIQALLEVVHRFVQQHTGSLPNFITWWQDHGGKCKLPLQENKEAMTIMTIHQAKGIAFQVVLVPFCAWAFHHPPQHPPILWCHTSIPPFDQLPQAPVYFGSQLKETYYQAAYYQEEQQTYLEGLNLLYVAFTRARQQLYIGFPATDSEKVRNTAQLLQHVLTHNEADFKKNNGLRHCHENGLRRWEMGNLAPSNNTNTTKKEEKESYMPAMHPTMKHYQEVLARMGPTSTEQKLGILWHDLLAKITQKEEVAPVVADYLTHGHITALQAQQLLREIATWWQHPTLADWFSGAWEIKQEATILLPNGTSFRPDRVMLRAKEAVVLDFKTGQQAESHTKQLRDYGRLLQAMQYEKVSGYLFYIPTQQLVQVF